MSHYMDKTRLVVAKRQDEEFPMIIGAIAESTWEIISEEDWNKWKQEMAEKYFDADWTAYDYIDVIMSYPNDKLTALFEARNIVPTGMEVSEP
jgi:hypothetical protein